MSVCGRHGRGDVSGLGEAGVGSRVELRGHRRAGQPGHAQGGGRKGGHRSGGGTSGISSSVLAGFQPDRKPVEQGETISQKPQSKNPAATLQRSGPSLCCDHHRRLPGVLCKRRHRYMIHVNALVQNRLKIVNY